MIYSEKKKRLCVRLDCAHIATMRGRNYSINRTVNAALEVFFYELDHKIVEQWRRDDIKNKEEHMTHTSGTRSTQLRIEALFFDRMEIYSYVKSKVIWHALERYFHYIESNRIAQYKIDEIRNNRKP